MTDRLAQCVLSWPMQDRAALLVWPAVYSASWTSALTIVKSTGVGGVVLMKPSAAFAKELKQHISDLDFVARHGVLVSTDEEGGTVQRLSALGQLPSQSSMSQMPPSEVRRLLDRHAKIVAATGIDVVLAPVVDVRPAAGTSPIGNSRLFAGSAQNVAALGQLYVDAWERVGILPILKHFPGHGSATGDTHTEFATTPPLAQLRLRDLLPYAALHSSGAGVMVGHLIVPGLTIGTPASLSPAAIQLLRNDYGFANALVMTDSLEMKAVGLSVPAAAVTAIAAGDDVVIFTQTNEAAAVIAALVGAVGNGRLTESMIDTAAIRVAGTLEQHGTPCRAKTP
jgi:beta-N-acetylhexosaminidase